MTAKSLSSEARGTQADSCLHYSLFLLCGSEQSTFLCADSDSSSSQHLFALKTFKSLEIWKISTVNTCHVMASLEAEAETEFVCEVLIRNQYLWRREEDEGQAEEEPACGGAWRLAVHPVEQAPRWAKWLGFVP